jgi:hypothetical protein
MGNLTNGKPRVGICSRRWVMQAGVWDAAADLMQARSDVDLGRPCESGTQHAQPGVKWGRGSLKQPCRRRASSQDGMWCVCVCVCVCVTSKTRHWSCGISRMQKVSLANESVTRGLFLGSQSACAPQTG